MDSENVKLGKLPAKSDPRALMAAHFLAIPKDLPKATNFWPKRKAFPLRNYGNREYGDCTKASQALLAMRMERLETRQTPKITDEEVIRVYKSMTTRLYQAQWPASGAYSEDADTGAYETDALSEWRKPDLTFRDAKGRPLTIDVFLSVDNSDILAVKSALWTAGAHGIKFCVNLPIAFQRLSPPQDWDIPDVVSLTGDWLPGSWGGHSLTGRDWDEKGLWFVHSWDRPDQRITWRAFAAYCDECHLVMDSVDSFRKRGQIPKRVAEKIKSAVNEVSDQKIK